MNLLVISNMAPSPHNPAFGSFVKNQVDQLQQNKQFEYLEFVRNVSSKKGWRALTGKYIGLLLALFKQAVFSKKRFDIIHVHYFYPTIWYAIIYKYLRNPGVKIIVTFHGSDIYCYSNPSSSYTFATRFIDHAIFVSDTLKQQFYRQDLPSSVLSAGILDSYQAQRADKSFDLIMVELKCQ